MIWWEVVDLLGWAIVGACVGDVAWTLVTGMPGVLGQLLIAFLSHGS
jgi:hypothetical protein